MITLHFSLRRPLLRLQVVAPISHGTFAALKIGCNMVVGFQINSKIASIHFLAQVAQKTPTVVNTCCSTFLPNTTSIVHVACTCAALRHQKFNRQTCDRFLVCCLLVKPTTKEHTHVPIKSRYLLSMLPVVHLTNAPGSMGCNELHVRTPTKHLSGTIGRMHNLPKPIFLLLTHHTPKPHQLHHLYIESSKHTT